MDSDSLNKMSQLIFCYIPTVPRLTKLFQDWCMLDDEEKHAVNNIVLAVLGLQCKDIYKAIREALIRWEIVQDTEGAPGFNECTAIEYTLTDKTEVLVLNIIKTLETAVCQITAAKCEELEVSEMDLVTEEADIRTTDTPIKFIHNIAQMIKAKRNQSGDSGEELSAEGENIDSFMQNMRRTKSSNDLLTSPPRKLKKKFINGGRQVQPAKVALCVCTDITEQNYDTE